MSQCQAIAKSTNSQCLRTTQNKYCTQHQNLFSGFPGDIISKCGSFLEFKESANIIKLEKNQELQKIYNSKKCVTLNFVTNTTDDIKKNLVALKNLCKYIPKLQYLKLTIQDPDTTLYQYEFGLQQYLYQIFAEIKNFRYLRNLEFTTFMEIMALEDEFLSYQKFGSDTITYLSINIKVISYWQLVSILQNFPNLKYFEYDRNIDIGGSIEMKFPENKIETVSFQEMNLEAYNFNLTFFKDVKRVILNYIDYLLLEDLGNLQNLEVLEFDTYHQHFGKNDYLYSIDTVPKSIKFLGINLRNGVLDDDKSFYTDLIHQLPRLEYLRITNFIDIRIIEKILDLFNDTSVKYLYFDFVEIYDVKDILQILKKLIKSGVMIEKLITYVDIDPNIYGKKYKTEHYIINKTQGQTIYTFEHTLKPNNWLLEHGYTLRPECQN